MIFSEVRSIGAKGEAAVVKTSGELGWRRLDAKIYRFSPGEYTWNPIPSHRVLMHLAGRARLRLLSHAKGEAREAKSGLVWLSPAGRANTGLEVVDGAAEMLQLLTPMELTGETRASEYGLTLESLTIVERDGISDPVIEALGRSILAELDTPDPAGALYADSVAATLSAYILRRYARVAEPQPSPRLADPRLERAITYIEENLGRELSLETLAAEASLSLFHFARAFKTAVGVAPHRFVLQRRIELARALLRDEELSIAMVAQRCGFASQAHLTHVFRRSTGSTPGAYRANVRE